MIADDAFAFADARVTARALATLVRGIGEVDLVVCGDGSADMYAGQVDVQLAAELGMPVVNAVTSIKLSNSAIAEVAFVSDLVRWSNLYLPGKLDEILDALPQQRDPVPLGIFYPARPKGGACFVFGYNYYAGRVWVGALFISVELDSAQFPAPQVPGCYLVLTDGKGDSYAFGAQGSAAEPAPEELLAAGGKS